jgi:hypothetical protein
LAGPSFAALRRGIAQTVNERYTFVLRSASPNVMLHLKDQGVGAMVVKAESPSSIASLALALSYRREPGLKFMVMTAFFDESGTHGMNSPV